MSFIVKTIDKSFKINPKILRKIPYFAPMIDSNFSEKTTGETEIDIDSDTFKQFLYFVTDRSKFIFSEKTLEESKFYLLADKILKYLNKNIEEMTLKPAELENLLFTLRLENTTYDDPLILYFYLKTEKVDIEKYPKLKRLYEKYESMISVNGFLKNAPKMKDVMKYRLKQILPLQNVLPYKVTHQIGDQKLVLNFKSFGEYATFIGLFHEEDLTLDELQNGYFKYITRLPRENTQLQKDGFAVY